MALRMLLPACILLLLVAVVPLQHTLALSFTDASADDPSAAAGVGFGNYLARDGGQWFGILADPRWWNAVRNTVIFALCSVTLELLLGMAIALSLNREFRGRALVRTAVLVPWAIPTIVSAQIWAWMLHDQYGVINALLRGLGLIDEGVAWLSQSSTALAAIIVIDAWKSTPFMALMILAALQTVPKDLLEAARIDGAGPVQTFRRIVLPMIFPAVAVAVVFRLLDALRVFDLIYIVNPSGESVMSMSVYVRRVLFEYGRFGEGSAASVLLFLVVAGLAVLWIRVSRVIERTSP
ncbi:MAG: sugar ABC transporter permease [Solimonas sp.]